MTVIKKIANQFRLFKDYYKIEVPFGVIPQLFQELKVAASRSYPFDSDMAVIWLKTPKTAGSAIQTSLENAGYLRMMKPGKRPITGVFSGRMNEFMSAYPEFWDNSYKFAIVRNPYDKFVSGWKYLRATQDRELIDVLKNPPAKEPRYGDYTHLTMTQTQQLYRDGQLIVDRVLHYEDLADNLNEMLASFDLPPVELPVVNKGRHRSRNYMDYFNEEARCLFLERYGEDFDNFGYERDP
jgi:hypothetical protein